MSGVFEDLVKVMIRMIVTKSCVHYACPSSNTKRVLKETKEAGYQGKNLETRHGFSSVCFQNLTCYSSDIYTCYVSVISYKL